MKKRIGSMMLAFSLFSVSLFSGVTSVNATTISKNSSGKSFSKKWSVVAVNTESETFVYGYDTFLFNEDYVKTYHDSQTHTGYVKNSGGVESKTKAAGKTLKVDIRHCSGTVYYRYSY